MLTKTKVAKSAVSSYAHGGKNFQDRICNLVPSRDIARDWTFEDAAVTGPLGATTGVPPSLDLRDSWWEINDQSTTGSCVGWAAADGVLRYHLIRAGRLSVDQMLSPRFVWMASKETDEFDSRPQTFIEEAGTSLKNAMDVIRKYGCVLDSELPFALSTFMYTGSENVLYASASTRRAANYFNLRKNLTKWKSWLASRGPILVGLQVDDTWDDAHKTGGMLDQFNPTSVRGGHAVCVVGYTADDRMIIRNSWGKGWGDDGFGYASCA